jgi:alpha-N-arabinofuranosidase
MCKVRSIWISVLAVVIISSIRELSAVAESGSVTIDTAKTGEPISKYVYCQFIENQGRCFYGGIWAEMLEDRKFFYPINFYFPWGENKFKSPWKPIGFDTIVVMDKEKVFVGEHTPRIDLDGRKPRGIMQDNLGLIKGKKYDGRIILAGDNSVKVQVSLVWGPRPGDRQTITISNLTNEYKKTPFSFTAGVDTDYGRLEIVSEDKGTLYIGTASLMPADNIQGMRADVIKLLKEMNSNIYRWPGGIYVNDYKWRSYIGDIDKRAPRQNRVYWSDDVASRDFGPDEFMAFCRVLKTEPYVMVSATSQGDDIMAAKEVEYFNGSIDSPMGKLRAENGHPEPYNVKWWGVGNEMWGAMPVADYIIRHNKIAKAMRKADPSIKLVAVGGLGAGEDIARERGWVVVNWSEEMLKGCADYMDLISEHIYGGYADSVVEHARQIPRAVRHNVEAHRNFRRVLDSIRGRSICLALDEFNHFWYSTQIYGEAAPRYYFREAFGVAAGLHEIYRNSDMIFMANTHPVNVHGQVKTTKTDAALETTGLVWKLYRNHFGNLPVAVTTNLSLLDSEDYPVDVVAALTEDRKALTIGIVNSTERKYEIGMELKGARLTGEGQLWLIANSNPMAYNEPGVPDRVKIEEKTFSYISNKLDVSPLSISLYKLSIR